MTATSEVREQYENFPFPPLEIGALSQLCPPQADARFAYAYARGEQLPNTGLRILDAGCGTGFSTLKLLEANPQAEILALDLSEPSLAIARERVQQSEHRARVRFEQADLQHLSDEQIQCFGQFDYIHSSGVIHHMPQPQKGLENMAQLLKPQGLAYFMVYSGRARREIEAIQELVYGLWEKRENWSEGLMLLRTLMQSLPEEHPLKAYYTKSLQTAEQLLGRQAAASEAFLVDTYLQRCEWRWTQKDWYALLAQTDWKPARWLDEASWQLKQYLPALRDYVEDLSEAEALALCDHLRPAHNFALFVTRESVELKDPPAFDWQQLPVAYGCVKVVATAYPTAPQALEHGMGLQLTMPPALLAYWQAIDGQHSWQAIWQQVQTHFPELSEHEVEGFAQQLLRHRFVGCIVHFDTL